jgi:hypothetical protein
MMAPEDDMVYHHPRRYPRPNARLVEQLRTVVSEFQRMNLNGIPIPREVVQRIVDLADMALLDMRPKLRIPGPGEEWIEEPPPMVGLAARYGPRLTPGADDRAAG